MRNLTLALGACLFAIPAAVTLQSEPAEPTLEELLAGIPGVNAEENLASHYRVGPCGLVDLLGDWIGTEEDGVTIARPAMNGVAAVLVLPDGEIIAHEMQTSGEVVFGPEWITIRPCESLGVAGNGPWGASNSLMSGMPASPCSPSTYDAPEADFLVWTTRGDCLKQTEANGGCDSELQCLPTGAQGCYLEFHLLGQNDDVIIDQECGDSLIIQWYCDNGVKRIRICE